MKRRNPNTDAAVIKHLKEQLELCSDETTKHRMISDIFSKQATAMSKTIEKVYKAVGLERDDLDWNDEGLFDHLKKIIKVYKKKLN